MELLNKYNRIKQEKVQLDEALAQYKTVEDVDHSLRVVHFDIEQLDKLSCCEDEERGSESPLVRMSRAIVSNEADATGAPSGNSGNTSSTGSTSATGQPSTPSNNQSSNNDASQNNEGESKSDSDNKESDGKKAEGFFAKIVKAIKLIWNKIVELTKGLLKVLGVIKDEETPEFGSNFDKKFNEGIDGDESVSTSLTKEESDQIAEAMSGITEEEAHKHTGRDFLNLLIRKSKIKETKKVFNNLLGRVDFLRMGVLATFSKDALDKYNKMIHGKNEELLKAGVPIISGGERKVGKFFTGVANAMTGGGTAATQAVEENKFFVSRIIFKDFYYDHTLCHGKKLSDIPQVSIDIINGYTDFLSRMNNMTAVKNLEGMVADAARMVSNGISEGASADQFKGSLFKVFVSNISSIAGATLDNNKTLKDISTSKSAQCNISVDKALQMRNVVSELKNITSISQAEDMTKKSFLGSKNIAGLYTTLGPRLADFRESDSIGSIGEDLGHALLSNVPFAKQGKMVGARWMANIGRVFNTGDGLKITPEEMNALGVNINSTVAELEDTVKSLISISETVISNIDDYKKGVDAIKVAISKQISPSLQGNGLLIDKLTEAAVEFVKVVHTTMSSVKTNTDKLLTIVLNTLRKQKESMRVIYNWAEEEKKDIEQTKKAANTF